LRGLLFCAHAMLYPAWTTLYDLAHTAWHPPGPDMCPQSTVHRGQSTVLEGLPSNPAAHSDSTCSGARGVGARGARGMQGLHRRTSLSSQPAHRFSVSPSSCTVSSTEPMTISEIACHAQRTLRTIYAFCIPCRIQADAHIKPVVSPGKHPTVRWHSAPGDWAASVGSNSVATRHRGACTSAVGWVQTAHPLLCAASWRTST